MIIVADCIGLQVEHNYLVLSSLKDYDLSVVNHTEGVNTMTKMLLIKNLTLFVTVH